MTGVVLTRFLGRFEVTVEGIPVDVGGAKQRAVLAMLLWCPGRRVSIESLVGEVWGGEPSPRRVRSLRTHVSNLRRRLPPGITITGSEGAYWAEGEHLRTDLADVELLVAASRAASEPAERYALMSQAWACWRGPVLEGLDGRWAADVRTTVEIRRRECLIALTEAALAAAQPLDLVRLLEEAQAESPFDERITGLLMACLYEAGRPADALAAYRSLERALGLELGVLPGSELRGLEQRILEHAALPSAPGPAASSSIPAPLGDLVGRDDQIGVVLEGWGRSRLLTITGPAGVGKTRFSVELARRLEDRYRANRWFVDLATVTDDAAVDEVIVHAMRIQPREGKEPLESVIDSLRTRSALLVVDNCEHLAWSVAHSVATILRACPDVVVVATSRTALHVDGELEWRLPPLVVPDSPEESDQHRRSALDLVLHRAPASFSVTEDNSADLVELCRSLDGLPLAIELAASRLGAMSPGDIVRELHHRLAALSPPGHPRTGRQATLSDAIAWSVELVSPEAGDMLGHLGVMAGWFDAGDAAAVFAAPADRVGSLLSELTAQSLIVADTAASVTRYRLLETIRQFAIERLGDGAPGVRRLHGARFATVAEREARRLRGSAEASAVEELTRAHDNLRAAIGWSIDGGELDTAARIIASLPDSAYFRTRYELAAWSSRAVASCGPEHPLWHPMCGTAARGAWVLGRFEEAERYASQAGEGRRSTPGRCGEPADVLADIALYRGDTEQARSHYLAQRQAALVSGDLIRRSWATYYLAVVAAVRRRWSEAAFWAREALEPARESGNPTALSCALYANGLAVKHADPGAAIAMFDEAIRIAESVTNEWFGGIARMERASTLTAHDDLAAGLDGFLDVIDRWNRAGDVTQLRLTWRYLIPVLARLDRCDDAAVLSGALLADRKSITTHPGPAVRARLEADLGAAAYNRLLVRGSVLQTWELVTLTTEAVSAEISATGRAS